VTLRGAPVTTGLVTFHGPDNQVASAPIEPDGSYKATNVPLGAVKVTVRPRPPAASGMEKRLQQMKRGSAPAPDTGGVPLPQEYADPEKSGLGLTVTAKGQSFDIDMK
jgi:hypothetical protein